MSDAALQDRYAPNGICFGCGPSNAKGLRIKSHVRGDEVLLRWRPEKHYEAYEGVLSGGAIGTLMDCHSLWAAAYHLMKRDGADAPPTMVTAEYTIKMRRPTPTDGEIEIVARVVDASEDRATVEAKQPASSARRRAVSSSRSSLATRHITAGSARAVCDKRCPYGQAWFWMPFVDCREVSFDGSQFAL